MIDISAWIEEFLHAAQHTFAERIYFVGIQGSYARGEANETSDIDVVLILDEVSATDLEKYDSMLNSLQHRELVCGFVSGKEELFNWDSADLFQFYYDTKAIVGSLKEIEPLIKDVDVCKAIKTAACNIYHGCIHNMLHDKSPQILIGLYKIAYFALIATVFRQTGEYIGRIDGLLPKVSSSERIIAENYRYLKSGGTVDFYAMSNTLLEWSKGLIIKTK